MRETSDMHEWKRYISSSFSDWQTGHIRSYNQNKWSHSETSMNGRTMVGMGLEKACFLQIIFFWMSAAGCNGIPDINQRKKTKKKNLYCLHSDPLYNRVSGSKLHNSTSGLVKECGTSQFLFWAAQLRIDSACGSIPLPSHTFGLPTWLYFAKDYAL